MSTPAAPEAGTITMFSTTWCGYCRRLKGQLDSAGIGYTEVNIEEHPDAATLVEQANGGNQTVPTILFPDGTIAPDARWVRDNIRTETLPIMGRVTCHRLMLTQLRGALQDVVDAGLASSLTTYDGCYVPRFIERNPENSISLHTWGIAIDMDAASNYRGIRGTMNPEVVKIFKRWGFRWGGDWRYTDPMHFELAALLDAPKG